MPDRTREREQVAADATGFSHQLVVKTREAAADPALASIDFGLKGNGVTLRKEQNGELKALDSAGQTLFTSAKPQMWPQVDALEHLGVGGAVAAPPTSTSRTTAPPTCGTFMSLPRSAYVAPGNWDAFKAKLVAGDFNGDGRDDILALYGFGDGTVAAYTLLARPDGGFADPVKSWTRKPGDWNYNASRLTAGDYNGDGRADAAIMFDYGNGRSALFTLPGRPDGGLNDDFVSWTRESGWWGTSLGNVVSGDTDKDGRADISVMYNTGKGATSAYTFKARPDGGFNDHLRSWEATPGTW